MVQVHVECFIKSTCRMFYQNVELLLLKSEILLFLLEIWLLEAQDLIYKSILQKENCYMSSILK